MPSSCSSAGTTRFHPPRVAVADPANEVLLSVVTPLELQIKVNINKLSFAKSVRELVQFEVGRGALSLLPITLDHIDALSRLSSPHRDPFDRLPIAQAIHDGLTLVTGDQSIHRYPVQWMWG